MNPAPVRSMWRAPRRVGGPYVRGPVRGSGPGAVRADDEWIDEEAVRRGCLGHEHYRRYPMTALTLAERCEVVIRMRERFVTLDDAAIHLGWSIPVVRAYAHWADTGEWIASNDLSRVLAERERQSCESAKQ